MKRLRRHPSLLAVAVMVTALLTAPPARAKDDPGLASLLQSGPAALLAEADRRHNDFKDQSLRIRMTVHGGSDEGRVLEFWSITKDGSRRAIRFIEPADLRGMGVVIKGSDEIYVRLPDSRKVRRVASHARKQSFQGTDWSFDDMAIFRYGQQFEPTKMEVKSDFILLDLRRKPGVDLSYERVRLWINREHLSIDRIEYYHDANEKPVKLQTREKLTKPERGPLTHTKLVLRNLRRDHWTVTEVTEMKFNTGVPDSTFSKRWLIRGL